MLVIVGGTKLVGVSGIVRHGEVSTGSEVGLRTPGLLGVLPSDLRRDGAAFAAIGAFLIAFTGDRNGSARCAGCGH
jgi:hypothetical protein